MATNDVVMFIICNIHHNQAIMGEMTIVVVYSYMVVASFLNGHIVPLGDSI